MKGKISHDGYLMLYRKNAYRFTDCPFKLSANCNDQCSLFGEPEKMGNPETAKLELCHKT